ncbi:pentapeptide repeat-containing protein [Streptomyces sp. Lzd4kr]|nr:pentapeptide repeat-containing protein [Streptomyces sp. Lzd4kr]
MNALVKRIALVMLVALGAVGIYTLITEVPWAVEGDNARDKTLQPSAGILITGLRTALLAALAGLIALGTLYLACKNHRVSLDQLRETRKQFDLAQQQFAHVQEQFEHTQAKDRRQEELTREGQVTDRYVEAIKLLSAEKNLTQWLGGIYSLERIMRDSEKDHATVVEVLAAFVRQHAPRGGGSEKDNVPPTSATEDDYRFVPEEHVRAALTVLGRRPPRDESFRVDLSDTALHGAQLSGARLERANLFGADLSESTLTSAKLMGADLTATDLSSANLIGADMTGAVMDFDPPLTGTDLAGADLTGAILTDVVGCTVELLVSAHLYSSTRLPTEFGDHPQIQAHIKECEDKQNPLRAAASGLG